MKEFEKLLLEDTKRKETEKALTEIRLGLFEQKEEPTIDFTKYTKMTYGKKYKGLYDLYQDNETFELAFICPLVENNKGDDNERLDLAPYAYDVLYLEYLTAEEYELVKKASVHEKSLLIDVLYRTSIIVYFLFVMIAIASVIAVTVNTKDFNTLMLVCAPMVSTMALYTGVLPILLIQYRKYKGQ